MQFNYKWPASFHDREKSSVKDMIDDVFENRNAIPCHPGVVSVEVISLDALNVKYLAKTMCSCGKSIKNIQGSTANA